MRWLVLSSLLAWAIPAGAAVFVVDNTADDIDAIPGDGICAAPSGGCTLRASVIEANQLAGYDEISVPAGTYLLTIPGAEESAALSGDLDVLDDVAIRGSGAATTIIDAASSDGALSVGGELLEVDIENLTLARGAYGLRVDGAASAISVADCFIEGASLAGIYSAFPPFSSGGGLDVLRTSIRDNPGDALVWNHNINRLHIESSEIARNGGAIRLTFILSGQNTVRGTVIEDNGGGGIITDDNMAVLIEDSIIRRNDGAGVRCYEAGFEIYRTTIADNAGTGIEAGCTVRLSESAVVGNDAGGIVVRYGAGTLDVDNSTIAENSGATVGGIRVEHAGWARIRNSTIVGNNGSIVGGVGVGVSHTPAVAPVLTSSVVAGNSSMSAASDCGIFFPSQGPIAFEGGNVVGNSSGCEFTSFDSDQIGTPLAPIDPLLGPLNMNGGPTPSHALLAGSPAIDTGTDACTLVDQRGFQRPIDGNANGNPTCDSGAFEYGAGDFDGDGLPDDADNCPRVTNSGQGDVDSDDVGNACDNCLLVANPRVPWNYSRMRPWASVSGGQRDDDRDGFGNKCDARFVPGGSVVGGLDLAQFRASSGRSVSAHNCGTSGTALCAAFDLDESEGVIGGLDLARFRAASGYFPGPKCDACPLP